MKHLSILRVILFSIFILLLQWTIHHKTAAYYSPDRADFSCAAVSEIPRSECQALVDLFNSTAGPSWFNNDGWLQNNQPCTWYGINCPFGYGHITHIFLDENNLSGTLPASLGNLNLRWLVLSHNLLTGPIPKQLAAADILQLLLNNNRLTGALPVEIGHSTKLILDLTHNHLQGELPDSLGQLTDLDALALGHNDFYGPLPGSLTNLRELRNFSFDHTGLCEPSEGAFQFWLLNIADLQRTDRKCGEIKPWTLMYYFATDNNLVGDLDSQLGLLKNAAGNDAVNIVYFYDRRDNSGSYYGAHFSEGFTYNQYMDEKSTGRPETLTDFINWSQQDFPAEHYALILIDHAYGFSGFGADEHVGADFGPGCPHYPCLTFKELREALEPIQRLDVIYLAGCAAASIEAAYELRDQMDFYVASEQLAWSPRDHGNYIQGKYTIDEVTTAYELAQDMANSYLDDTQLPLTSSVMRIDQVENVVAKTNALGVLLQQDMAVLAPDLLKIRAEVQHYSTRDDMDIDQNDTFNLVDLKDVALKIEARINDHNIQDAAHDLQEAVDSFVLVNKPRSGQFQNSKWQEQCPPEGQCSWDLQGSYGVSIYWPDVCGSFYSDEWLDFAAGADCDDLLFAGPSPNQPRSVPVGWATMLVDYVAATNPEAAIEDDLPALIEPLSTHQFSYLPFVSRVYPDNS